MAKAGRFLKGSDRYAREINFSLSRLYAEKKKSSF
jgi:hypothetical protein